MRLVLALATLVFGSVLGESGALGQVAFSGSVGPISGTASESVPLKPEKLRLVMWVQSKGKDAKSAITALNEQKARVKKDLESMKSDSESVQFSASRVASDELGNQQRAMLRMQMQGKPNAKAAKPPTVFLARCAVKAEWALPVSEGDALAILPANLLEQIKVRDLEGKNVKPMLDGDAQEQLDEMESMMQEQYYGSSPEANGPKILFVARIPLEVRERAFQSAFKNATEDAQMLSKASAIKLGKPIGISKTPSPYDYALSSYGRGYMDPASMPAGFVDDSKEIVTASQPDELFFRVTVTIAYASE
jgi:uncharacterized protein YggE